MPTFINIPRRLKKKLESNKDNNFSNNVYTIVNQYSQIPKQNKMFFFPEYTDHGVGHIERVLEIVDKLIPNSTYKKMTYQDVGVIIIAVVLHDIGMHTSIDLFKNMT